MPPDAQDTQFYSLGSGQLYSCGQQLDTTASQPAGNTLTTRTTDQSLLYPNGFPHTEMKISALLS